MNRRVGNEGLGELDDILDDFDETIASLGGNNNAATADGVVTRESFLNKKSF